MSRLANVFARVMLRHHVQDSTGGFRCYGRSVLEWLLTAPIFAGFGASAGREPEFRDSKRPSQLGRRG